MTCDPILTSQIFVDPRDFFFHLITAVNHDVPAQVYVIFCILIFIFLKVNQYSCFSVKIFFISNSFHKLLDISGDPI